VKVDIYGKENCSYCTAAKNLAAARGLEYTYKQLEADYGWDIWLKLFPYAKSFPQIVIDGEAIGGFEDFKSFLENHS
jgi:glutaredoxin 3